MDNLNTNLGEIPQTTTLLKGVDSRDRSKQQMKLPKSQEILFKGKTEKYKSLQSSMINVSSLDKMEYSEDEEEIKLKNLSI